MTMIPINHEDLSADTLGTVIAIRVSRMSAKQLGEWFALLTESQAAALFGTDTASNAKAPKKRTAPAPKPRTTKPRIAKPRIAKSTDDDRATVLAYVRDNPAANAMRVGKATGLTPAVTKAALAGLVASGELEKSGKARGTTYAPRYVNGAGVGA